MPQESFEAGERHCASRPRAHVKVPRSRSVAVMSRVVSCERIPSVVEVFVETGCAGTVYSVFFGRGGVAEGTRRLDLIRFLEDVTFGVGQLVEELQLWNLMTRNERWWTVEDRQLRGVDQCSIPGGK